MAADHSGSQVGDQISFPRAWLVFDAGAITSVDRQGLTEVIGPNRQFETLRECLAAYEARSDPR